MSSDRTELVKRLKAGDKDGADMLCRAYSEELYRYILRIVGSRRDAEDILE